MKAFKMSLSVNSLQRALTAETGLASAAGNYKSSTIATLAKGFLGVLTLGIGYGIMKLYEHFNSREKVEQFTSMSRDILNKLDNRGNENKVDITTFDNKMITLTEDGRNVTITFDGKTATLTGTSLDEIKANLEKDIRDNPELYGREPDDKKKEEDSNNIIQKQKNETKPQEKNK